MRAILCVVGRRARAGLLALACGGLSACAAQPLLQRAIDARGGPLTGVTLYAEANLYRGMPGRWRYTRTYLAPGYYAWQVETSTGVDSYIFNGQSTRAFIDGREVGTDTSPNAPLRSQARWTAVSLLDVLATPDVTLYPLLPGELPPGADDGLLATFADGTAYRLAFDADTRLIWMRGPLDLSPLASGVAEVRFGDPQRSGAFLLPHSAAYEVDGLRLADETLLAACPDPAALSPASFAAPSALPTCAAPAR